ncbi:putative type-B carboxylesterase lipase family protein [Lyophyllum shimeji]|uniref:Carboxylic ester hydrolase n=1 Tax=Lyophyllum shimeji TaxID=47721 RepID=A0A9P3PQY3_LYOSH|nr:putative type-B carboxylesterase lipase family protein [Lyophyllum shimeji]
MGTHCVVRLMTSTRLSPIISTARQSSSRSGASNAKLLHITCTASSKRYKKRNAGRSSSKIPRHIMLLTPLALLLPVLGVSTAPSAPIVDLGYAKYQGTVDATTGNTLFLGMRYAAPPTGSLRWQPPQRPATVAGVQQANAQPPSCMTAGSGTSPTNPFRAQNLTTQAAAAASEDCLFLNVFTPGVSASPSGRKPVVVWIHGGGYQAGNAQPYNGEDLIREANGGMVAVAIQYRLGVFGFLPGSKVKAGGALNAGLLDQEFALRWVQEHITKFGGDPSKVTIWGESAGAGSVLQHVIAHDGQTTPPLFRAAITSSSFLPSQYNFNDPIPEALYDEVVSQTSCTSSADTLACLRGVDVATLQAANVKISTGAFFGTFIFVPVVDGIFIRQRATQALRQRKVNGNALLSVTNTLEGFNFVNQSTASTVQIPDYISQLFPNFGSPEIRKAAALYANLGTPISQAVAIMGEAIFICPTYFLLRAFGQSFKSAFAIPPSHHGDDIQYYFPSSTVSGFPAFNNTAFIGAFSGSFLDFAMSLNPNVKSDPSNITPLWNIWAAGEVEMLFNKTAAGEPVVQPIKTSSALLQRCAFWESVGALSGQ